MSSGRLVLGTRGSALALVQTHLVRAAIRQAHPRLLVEERIIKTSGDKQSHASLSRSGVKGLFIKEMEEALLRGRIDAAVHSLKDMPVSLPAGLCLGAVGKRSDACDVLVGHSGTNVHDPKTVHTSSPRRVLQARLLWPACEVCEIRGNVETRLRKIAEGTPGEAVLLAAAGLERLDFLHGDGEAGALRFDPPLPYRRLSLREMIPAPGQAAIAVEIRSDDPETAERIKALDHAPTRSAVTAERAFLKELGGGCATPIAIHGRVTHEGLTITAIVGLPGRKIWRGEKTGARREAEPLGRALALECRAALGLEPGSIPTIQTSITPP